ncbi:hypothetical protein VTK56DRAFT_2255 [Thermocarpiscus australiensis]
MLRRRSLKSRSDLKRRKSTSSTHGVILEYLDPTLAQRDAHIAACEAYTRARTRTMANIPLFPPTPESSPRRQPRAQNSGNGDDPGAHCPERGGGHDIRRQQSVRFMGPCSVQAGGRRSRTAYSSRNSNEMDSDSADAQQNPEINTSRSPILERVDTDPSIQPPPPPQRTPPPAPLPAIATRYIDALAAGEEYYTPEDDIASAPSSYRRLRRPRSTFAYEAQGIQTNLESPLSFLNGEKSPSSRQLPGLGPRRLSRSEPNENIVSDNISSIRSPESTSVPSQRRSLSKASTSRDETTTGQGLSGLSGLPEDRCSPTDQSRRQRRHKRSTLFGSRRRQRELEMRKSLRSNSSTEAKDQSISSPRPSAAGQENLRSRARKLSMSFRMKLRNIFTLARPEGDTISIPCQHIEAQRTHVTEGFGVSQALNTDPEAPSDEDWRAIHSVPAKVPSLQAAPSGLARSSQASLESLKSGGERKASDDESLTTWVHSGPSTLTSEQQQQWREWERQRLSSIEENGTRSQAPSIRRQVLGTADAINPSPIVDSQRVYSALMKRMRAVNAEQQSQAFNADRPISVKEDVDSSSDRTENTIKRTVPGREVATPFDSLTTPTRASKRPSLSEHLRNSTSVARLSDWASGLADSAASHLFRTTSPYRRALRKSMEEEHNVWARRSSLGGHGPDTDCDSANEPAYSESVYSTDEGGLVPARNVSGANAHTGKRFAAGNAALSAQSPATYRPAGYREDSTASSVDWKTWLSANVGKLESSPPLPRAAEVEFALPTMPRNFRSGQFSNGHVRELAQIHGDCDDDDIFQPPTRKPTLPTTPLTEVKPNIVKLSPSQRSVKRTTPPSNGKSLPENECPARPPPPVPAKSTLRPSPLRVSRPNAGRYYKTPSLSSSPGLTAAVQRHFGPVPKGANIAADYSDSDAPGMENRRFERLWRAGLSDDEYKANIGIGDESFAFI